MYIESESQLPWLLFWRHHICNFRYSACFFWSKFLSFVGLYLFVRSFVCVFVGGERSTWRGRLSLSLAAPLLRLFDIIGVNAREQQKREREVCVSVCVCMCGDVMNFALGRRSVNEAHVATFCELSLRAHLSLHVCIRPRLCSVWFNGYTSGYNRQRQQAASSSAAAACNIKTQNTKGQVTQYNDDVPLRLLKLYAAYCLLLLLNCCCYCCCLPPLIIILIQTEMVYPKRHPRHCTLLVATIKWAFPNPRRHTKVCVTTCTHTHTGSLLSECLLISELFIKDSR